MIIKILLLILINYNSQNWESYCQNDVLYVQGEIKLLKGQYARLYPINWNSRQLELKLKILGEPISFETINCYPNYIQFNNFQIPSKVIIQFPNGEQNELRI